MITPSSVVEVRRAAFLLLYGLLLLLAWRTGADEQDDEQAAPCSVCRNGDPVRLPNKQVEVPVVGIRTCAEIEETVASMFTAVDSIYCKAVQDLGSLCGCSISDSACTLCHDGSLVPYPNRLLGGLFVTDFLEATLPPVPDEDPISCEVLEAVLHGRTNSSGVCEATQQEFSELCGCPEPPVPSSSTVGGDGTNSSNAGSDAGDEENEIDDIAPAPGGGCNICPDGGEISLPDKTLDFDSLPAKDCSNLANFATVFLSPNSDECFGAQALGTYCGCPIPDEISCTVCGNGERVKYPDQELDWFHGGEYSFVDIPEKFQDFAMYLTCGLLESIVDSYDKASFAGVDVDAGCLVIQLRASICGCDPFWKEILLFWSYRVSGILSILGSSFILFQVLWRSERPDATYHQILLSISCFDLVSSLGYVLPLLPASSGMYGAKGNDATCQLQGFLLQLGITSMFYNIGLSIYYLLVIKFNWKEFRFQKLRRYFHAFVIVLGFGLAFGAFPFYGHQLATCLVQFPPIAESSIPNTFFFTVPMLLTLVTTMVTTGMVFHTVYSQEKRALKWKAKKNLSITKKVGWQCFLYATSFAITIPIRFVTNYVEYDKENHYWVAVVIGFVAPAQGLLNAIVFSYRAGHGTSSFFACCCHGSKHLSSTETDMDPASQNATGGPETNASMAEARHNPRRSFGSSLFGAAVQLWRNQRNRFQAAGVQQSITEDGVGGKPTAADAGQLDDLASPGNPNEPETEGAEQNHEYKETEAAHEVSRNSESSSSGSFQFSAAVELWKSQRKSKINFADLADLADLADNY